MQAPGERFAAASSGVSWPQLRLDLLLRRSQVRALPGEQGPLERVAAQYAERQEAGGFVAEALHRHGIQAQSILRQHETGEELR